MVEERGGKADFGGYQDLSGQKGREEVGKRKAELGNDGIQYDYAFSGHPREENGCRVVFRLDPRQAGNDGICL